MAKLAFILLSVLPFLLQAAPPDGNTFLREYNKGDTAFFWFGYVSGIADQLNAHSIVCLEGVTRMQARDVVAKFVQDHPADRHNHMLRLTQIALADAFPCESPPPFEKVPEEVDE